MFTVVHGIVNARALCSARSTLLRNLGAPRIHKLNTKQPILCATFFTSTHPVHSSLLPTSIASTRSWHRLFPSRSPESFFSPIQLALSRWSRSTSLRSASSRNILYRGVPRGGGGGGFKHRTFRQENSWKEWLDRIPNTYLIYGILGLNGIVFFMWQSALTNVVGVLNFMTLVLCLTDAVFRE
jgi:rhomboid-like protein